MNALVKYNNPILYQATEPVDMIDENVCVDLSNRVITYMLQNKGLGLSANQIGIGKALFAMRDNAGVPFPVFNPKVIEESETKESFWEGCLTFPKLYMMIKRPLIIKVEYQSVNAEVVTDTLQGMEARVFMHEMHHMRGEAFFHKNVSWFKINRACADAPQFREFLREYWNRTQEFMDGEKV
jgi:peptide deformylase